MLERLALAISILATQNQSLAPRLIEGKAEYNAWCREVQSAHFERLVHHSPTTIEASGFFLEILGGYRRISSHLSQLGYALIADTRPDK